MGGDRRQSVWAWPSLAGSQLPSLQPQQGREEDVLTSGRPRVPLSWSVGQGTPWAPYLGLKEALGPLDALTGDIDLGEAGQHAQPAVLLKLPGRCLAEDQEELQWEERCARCQEGREGGEPESLATPRPQPQASPAEKDWGAVSWVLPLGAPVLPLTGPLPICTMDGDSCTHPGCWDSAALPRPRQLPTTRPQPTSYLCLPLFPREPTLCSMY